MKKLEATTVLGVYVLISVLLNVGINAFSFSDVLEILWFCNWIAIFLGVGLIIKSKSMVSSVLELSVIAQFLWIFDFLLELGGYGFGRTAFLKQYGWVDFLLSVNLHAILIPISGYATWIWGFSKKSLILSAVTLFGLLPLTFLVTDVSDNINCVFYACDLKFDGVRFFKEEYAGYFLGDYLLFWIGLTAISHGVFCRLFSRHRQKKVRRVG